MNKLLSLILVVAVIAGNIVTATAQEDVLRPRGRKAGEFTLLHIGKKKLGITLGTEGGMNYNMYSADLSWDPALPNSPYKAFESGDYITGYFAFLADYPIDETFSLQGKLSYDAKAFSNTYTGQVDLRDQFGNLSFTNEEAYIKYSGGYVGLTFLLRANVTEDLFVNFGPVVLIPLGNFDYLIRTRYPDGDLVYNKTGTNEFRINGNESVNGGIGFEFGAGYKYKIGKDLWLVPALNFQLRLSNFNDASIRSDYSRPFTIGTSTLSMTNRTLNSLRLSVGLWFDL